MPESSEIATIYQRAVQEITTWCLQEGIHRLDIRTDEGILMDVVHAVAFPNEILDEIHCWVLILGDRRTARICAMVWRAWVARSQRRIFEDLVIRGERRAEEFTLKMRWLVNHQTLAAYVKTLTLQGVLGTGLGEELGVELERELVQAYLNVLPNVESLKICRSRWTGNDGELIPQIFPRLHSISIEDVACDTTHSNVLQILSFGDLLRVVHVSWISWHYQWPIPEATGSLRCDTLTVGNNLALFLQGIQWVWHMPSVQGLRVLRIERYGSPQVEFLRSALGANAASLEEFELSVEHMPIAGRQEQWENLHLTNCTQLKRAMISFCLDETTDVESVDPAVSIQHIELELWVKNIGQSDAYTDLVKVDWEAIGQYIDQLPHVFSIHIVLYSAWNGNVYPPYWTEVKQRLIMLQFHNIDVASGEENKFEMYRVRE
ncbi:hypothetical protein NM688_g413 [Phlebia brevispora]|uniref:Uncharacterized protein n=1 Tax=Phlebia brevispora TaxID=194682 RepID=A0ACC1TET5_9APHY|nr:hypothetical protein NM688_g413 [Phlebia brevispora]